MAGCYAKGLVARDQDRRRFVMIIGLSALVGGSGADRIRCQAEAGKEVDHIVARPPHIVRISSTVPLALYYRGLPT